MSMWLVFGYWPTALTGYLFELTDENDADKKYSIFVVSNVCRGDEGNSRHEHLLLPIKYL